jgi:hypothetical protein
MPKQPNTWHADQFKFIEWLALPKTERQPKTQKLFAREIGVDEGTLSDWKRLPGFMDDVTARARKQMQDAMSDVYGALVKAASKGDVQAIKLFFEMAGEYTPKQEFKGNVGLTWAEAVKQAMQHSADEPEA